MAMRMGAGRASAVRLACGVAAATLVLAGGASAQEAAQGVAKAATNRAASPDQRLYNGPELAPGQDLTGVWQLSSYDPALRPIDGKPLPFTDAGAKAFKDNQSKVKTEGGKNVCQPLGTPRAYVSPYPIMFMQVPRNLITIYHEENRTYRLIRLDAEHMDPGPWDPSYVGESVAKWDGDTLVVDSLNFNGMTWLDDSGVPVSDKLHVVEHWKLIDGGHKLQADFSIDDPTNFTHPWTGRRVFTARPGVTMQDDWVCGEPHRSLKGMPGIQKLYERVGQYEPQKEIPK